MSGIPLVDQRSTKGIPSGSIGKVRLGKDSINKHTMSGKPDDVRLIIDKLNQVAGTNYRSSTPKTKTLIQARLKEGFSLEDFYRVIEKKFGEWGKNPEMAKFIRPETLFGTKFESYLNQPDEVKPEDDYFAQGGFI